MPMLKRSLKGKLTNMGYKCKIMRQIFIQVCLNHNTLIINVCHKNHAQMWSRIYKTE